MRKPRKLKTNADSVTTTDNADAAEFNAAVDAVAETTERHDAPADTPAEPSDIPAELPPVPFPAKFDNDTGADIPDTVAVDTPTVDHDTAMLEAADAEQANETARLASRAATQLSRQSFSYPGTVGTSSLSAMHLTFLGSCARVVGRLTDITSAEIIDCARLFGFPRHPSTRGGYRMPGQNIGGIFNAGSLSVLRNTGLITISGDYNTFTINQRAVTYADFQRGYQHGKA